MYAENNLDVKISKRISEIGVESNFFIEAGANDGLAQSNTAMLEFHFGWRGILVEPNLENANRAKKNRPACAVVRGALVDKDYDKETIAGTFNELSLLRANGLMAGMNKTQLSEYPEMICEVPVVTLSKIFKEHGCPPRPALLSLDVEGYELQALGGLDFELWRPKVIVMEIAEHFIPEEVARHFKFMSDRGYVNDPSFEPGEHDFLFIDNK